MRPLQYWRTEHKVLRGIIAQRMRDEGYTLRSIGFILGVKVARAREILMCHIRRRGFTPTKV